MTTTLEHTTPEQEYPEHYEPPRGPAWRLVFGPGIVRGLWMGVLFFGLGILLVAGLRWWSAWEALWANVTIFNRAARSLTLVAIRELTLGDSIVAEAAEVFGMRSA